MFTEDFGDGIPIRLFVSGLHGKEHKYTDLFLKSFAEKVSEKELKGKLVLRSLAREEREYVSTLEQEYWNTEAGSELLSIIERVDPTIYLELHSYTNYSSLKDPERYEEKGVPPLVDFGSGILAGSVSPFLRVNKFQRNDFCFLLDIPRDLNEEAKLMSIMEVIGEGRDRDEILKRLKARFPDQTRRLKRYHRAFYNNEICYFSKVQPKE
ncbi:hypothetical protein AKJ64_00845 [candidate division MSBL1 archaeon SCGC-AAA259E17]|uniref:DUF2119 domain-containing protein n=1 Tax=candidate division MSBL1 archaeon SCGC-AAA259E17 TaxID=1698263 RepID=A0A133UH10_9EURY|nr:hypothetical protein AKJ64_00845 [candidate division MSBL1 archaeon SCGC-AAA259E17]